MNILQRSGMLLTASLVLFTTNVDAYSTAVLDLGDTTIEKVQIGYTNNPKLENLEYWFAKNAITNADGSAINAISDQLQDELFYTNVTRSYQVEFLGIGFASYHSPFGVFSYTGDPYGTFDPTKITYGKPLFIQNEVAKNSVYDFSITAGSYFGFYIDSNGTYKKAVEAKKTGDPKYLLSTMIAANKDNLDHAIFFETNKGYTIAFEDIVGGGDRDYEDLVINFRPTDGTSFTSASAVPEPSTVLLLGIGLLALSGQLRKKLFQQ